MLPTTVLLSAPVQGYASAALGWGLLLVLVVAAVVSWRYGLRLVRRKQPPAVAVGVVVLLVALGISLATLELVVALGT